MIIADDCSPDGTEKIVQGFIDNHPNGHWIKYHPHNENIGMISNFIFAYEETQGEFIALCEGDDYWCDKLKLQKQLTFLKQNQDCSICFSDVSTYLDFESRLIPNNLNKAILTEKLDIYNLAKRHYIFTPTALIKKKFDMLPEWIMDNVGCDTTLFLLQLEDGSKAFFLPEVTAVYRMHEGGVFSGRNTFHYEKRKKIELGMIQMIDCWIQHFSKNRQLIKLFKLSKIGAINKLRVIALENLDPKTVRTCAKQMMKLIYIDYRFLPSLIFSIIAPITHCNWITKNNI